MVRMPLPLREPFDGAALLRFLAARALPGVEEVEGHTFRRSLRLPHGAATVALAIGRDRVTADLALDDHRDLAAAVERCRRLCDLDADPLAIDGTLGADSVLGPLVRSGPGRRVPGTVDGAELAVRAVLGQQVTVAYGVVLARRLLATCGERLARPLGGVTHLFPAPDAIAGADPAPWRMPQARAAAVRGVAAAVAGGALALDPSADPAEVGARLRALPGIGPWTTAYVAMRALHDPDAFPAADAGVRRGLEALGLDGGPRAAERHAERWRPYRAYATQHLWACHAAAAAAA
jgi:AraC family transcriptional regulator, regulatory protein of adaptative response / DNA-3-methyladenine glycosylase II